MQSDFNCCTFCVGYVHARSIDTVEVDWFALRQLVLRVKNVCEFFIESRAPVFEILLHIIMVEPWRYICEFLIFRLNSRRKAIEETKFLIIVQNSLVVHNMPSSVAACHCHKCTDYVNKWVKMKLQMFSSIVFSCVIWRWAVHKSNYVHDEGWRTKKS